MYNEIVPVKCDACGRMVATYYGRDKGFWWGKYLKTGEGKICIQCIIGREGFKEGFKQMTGKDIDSLTGG